VDPVPPPLCFPAGGGRGGSALHGKEEAPTASINGSFSSDRRISRASSTSSCAAFFIASSYAITCVVQNTCATSWVAVQIHELPCNYRRKWSHQFRFSCFKRRGLFDLLPLSLKGAVPDCVIVPVSTLVRVESPHLRGCCIIVLVFRPEANEFHHDRESHCDQPNR